MDRFGRTTIHFGAIHIGSLCRRTPSVEDRVGLGGSVAQGERGQTPSIQSSRIEGQPLLLLPRMGGASPPGAIGKIGSPRISSR